MGQNRPQFRAATNKDPGQVKELVEKLEKHQNPDSDDSESYVRLELVKYVFNTLTVYVYIKLLIVFTITRTCFH